MVKYNMYCICKGTSQIFFGTLLDKQIKKTVKQCAYLTTLKEFFFKGKYIEEQ